MDKFPISLNEASKADLLRVPGIGPTSAERIIMQRQRHSIDTWRDLQTMGIVRKRASPFVTFSGNVPMMAKQLKLNFFKERPTVSNAPLKMAGPIPVTAAPCVQERTCGGCPLYGAPGLPGYQEVAAKAA